MEKNKTPASSILKCQARALLAACLAFVLILLLRHVALPEQIPYYALISSRRAPNSRSILTNVNFRCENSRQRGRRIIPMGEDAQLWISFRYPEAPVCAMGITFASPFEKAVRCEMYYPNALNELGEERRQIAIIPAGESEIFFQLPPDAETDIRFFRIDIDEEYEIADILVSDQGFGGNYEPGMHGDWRLMAALFVLLLFFAETALIFRKSLMALGKKLWKNRRRIGQGIAFTALAGAAGGAAAAVYSHFNGIGLRGIPALAIAMLTSLFAWEIRLLLKKKSPLTKAASPAPVPKALCPGSGGHCGRCAGKAGQILYFAGMALFCLLLVLESITAAQKAAAGNRGYLFIFPLVTGEVIFLFLLYRKYLQHRPLDDKKAPYLYALVLLFLAFLYLFAFLPFISPDEKAHYLSAYRIANLFLGKGTPLGESALIMRIEDWHFIFSRDAAMTGEYLNWLGGEASLFLNTAGYAVADATMATNALFGYFPAALGIALARLLKLSAAMTFYMSRAAGALFCAGTAVAIMKKDRKGAAPLFVVMGTPMLLHLMASCTYDAVTFCLVALFACQVFALMNKREKATRQDVLLCAFCGALMAPAKMVYFPLLFLAFLIPLKTLDEKRLRALLKMLLIAGAGLAAMVLLGQAIRWLSSGTALQRMLRESQNGHIVTLSGKPGYTISYILGHFGDFLLLCYKTFRQLFDEYFFSMLGSRLGRLEVSVPQVVGVGFFFMYLRAVNMPEEGELFLGPVKKTLTVILCLGCIAGITLAMALSDTPLSSSLVLGIQGRYFLPLLPVLAVVLRSRSVTVGCDLKPRLVFWTVLLNVWTLLYAFGHAIFR